MSLVWCCKNENKHLVVLGVNLSYEDMIMFKNYDLDKFISAYGRRDAHNFTLIIDANIVAVENIESDQIDKIEDKSVNV